MPAQIICIGNSTLDRVWPVAGLPASSGKYRASDYFEVGGGMAANAAVAVARLGGHVAYWGRAGDDTAGQKMKSELAGYGIDTTHFHLFAHARSSTSAVIVAQDGERTIVNFPGVNLPDDTDWLPLAQIRSALAVHADIRWVHGASAVLAAAKAAGKPTVLDAEIADASAFAAILPLVGHAIFSENGLRSFAPDAKLDTDAGRLKALERVRAFGCRVAAVTRGANGTLWLDEHGSHRQPAFPVQVVDTTGAGDVFHGAYVFALTLGQTVAQAMRFSSAVAALKCTRPGGRAGIPHFAEIEFFLAQHPR